MKMPKRQRPPLRLILRAASEIPRAIALGCIPVLLSTETQEQFEKIFEWLLAAPLLVDYYMKLLIAFGVVGVCTYLWRFGSSRHQTVWGAIHRFFGDIGGSLLTAIRTGLGAIMGFMLVWPWMEAKTLTVANYLEMLFLMVVLLGVCVLISILEETLRDPKEISRTGKI
ncbi:hypothetical protein F7R01_10450 [Pseudomonas argentinensis]|uniref:Uncharacterized protein n=1 Tax=Phytopseudomonas argentinensis TaxID=289370 RepID=A0A1I3I5U6_9GAMM|nr:hypothetical protein [Pseudomonas argentinensis]KAB0547912.1 hypothetical protein F7R01_10450 [Pseudomonas argentinensis]SFI43291.1 hypothetical protein SAMN05216602_1437 [Pseudomonas argentinensis]